MPFDGTKSDWIAQLEARENLANSAQTVVDAVDAAGDYEIAVYKAPANGAGTTITRASIFASVAITGAATNFQTLKFRQWRAGSVVVSGGFGSTYVTTASLALLTEKNLFSGALVLQPGDVITLRNVTTASGAALPALTAVIEASPSV